MDLDAVRTVVEVISFAVFVGIVAWAYSPRRRASLDRAARSVLED